MRGSNMRLQEAIVSDAGCAIPSAENPAATLNWVEYGDTLCLELRFMFSSTRESGPLSGSVFRFFSSGEVSCANWNRGEEFKVQGREDGFTFTSPPIENFESWEGDLEYFISSAVNFVKTVTAKAGIEIHSESDICK